MRNRVSALVVVVAVASLASWLAGVSHARVTPLNAIARQIHKANMLVVLDTSGSMNGVPGTPFSYSSEVGVDCDNGVDCRGWSETAGSCASTGRSCVSD